MRLTCQPLSPDQVACSKLELSRRLASSGLGQSARPRLPSWPEHRCEESRLGFQEQRRIGSQRNYPRHPSIPRHSEFLERSQPSMLPGRAGLSGGWQLRRVQKQWLQWPRPPIVSSLEFASSAVAGFPLQQKRVRIDELQKLAGRAVLTLPT